MFRRSPAEMRVLILAPVGRDAQLLNATMATLAVDTQSVDTTEDLLKLLHEGAGVAIVAEEALATGHVESIRAWLDSQPPWSDLPFIILTPGGRPTPRVERRARAPGILGNITLIERPARPETIQTAVRTALRARLRQYEMRSRQEALIRANADLEQF